MLGVACGMAYDVLRIFRRVKSCNVLRMGIEDTVYWCVMSAVLVIFLYHNNGGIIRAYVVFGMAVGMVLYELSIGRFIVKYLSYIFKYINKKIKILLKKVWKILYWGLKKIFKPFKIVSNLLSEKVVKRMRLKKRGAICGKAEKKGKNKKRQKCD
jgi:spore cortex biosynthesis protein YabQ